MRGLELSRAFYEEWGRPMIHSRFPEYEERIAVGLAGEGSECLGFDDERSRDHDFDPGFCLWLTEEDFRRLEFPLFRALQKLPEEFRGVRRQKQSLYGGGRKGVREIGDFYRQFTGSPGEPESLKQWLYLPEYALAAAVSGEVFRDDLGMFSGIRCRLEKGYPEDVRRKKIAARAVMMAQSGQYNYERCLAHGEQGAAALAVAEFVRACGSMVFLLNGRYMPYYKWMFRSMRQLPVLGDMTEELEALLNPATVPDRQDREAASGAAANRIERICARVIGELKRQGLSRGDWSYLEPHGIQVMETIGDPGLRTLHVMEG